MKNSTLGMGPIEAAMLAKLAEERAAMSAAVSEKEAGRAADGARRNAWLDKQPPAPGMRVRGSDLRAAAEVAAKK